MVDLEDAMEVSSDYRDVTRKLQKEMNYIAVAAREILIGQGRTTVPQTDDKVDESNESVEEEKNQKKDV